jgi:hypothetical protein
MNLPHGVGLRVQMSYHYQSYFNKVGHLHVCKQSKRGWEAQIYYQYFVTSQLHECEICILVTSQLYHQKHKL